jgi:hypothetical protein
VPFGRKARAPTGARVRRLHLTVASRGGCGVRSSAPAGFGCDSDMPPEDGGSVDVGLWAAADSGAAWVRTGGAPRLGGRCRATAERIRGEKKKLRQAYACRSFFFRAGPRSDPLHLRCLRSFLSLDDLELNLIALSQ